VKLFENSMWVGRLQIGDSVWLVKEQTLATVKCVFNSNKQALNVPTNLNWAPPLLMGDIELQYSLAGTERSEVWCVRANGQGFDCKPLLFPLADTLLQETAKQLDVLSNKVTKLERLVADLINNRIRSKN